MNKQEKSIDPRGPEYAGTAKCTNCHQDIYQSYEKTAHYLTSAAASQHSIEGSFSKDSNTVYYRPRLKVAMEQRDTGFYQVAYIDDVEQQMARFDIVVGSGRKGQSYLYWYGENIFQLPVSYYVPGKCWVNSPGFPAENVNFVRNIPVGCFECHSSFINKTGTKAVGPNIYDAFAKTNIIYGIDCERCHGPAADHVSFHEENPTVKQSRFITTHSGLQRQQKLDMCALCHSGARQPIKTAFNFRPGEHLSDYLSADTSTVSNIDVHGNQYQLLMASECFKESSSLTCSSCHNTHIQERDNLTGFSKKCMNCHNNPKHSFDNNSAFPALTIEKNCIDCHMPAKPSSIITMKLQSENEQIPALVRSHRISVYPEETKIFREKIKLQK